MNEWNRRYEESLRRAEPPSPPAVPEWMLEPRWLPLALRSHRVRVHKAGDRDVIQRRALKHHDRWRYGREWPPPPRVRMKGDRIVIGSPADRHNLAFPVFVGTVSGDERVQVEGVIRCNRWWLPGLNGFMLLMALVAFMSDGPWWRTLAMVVGVVTAELALLSFPRRTRQRAEILHILEELTGGTVAPVDWTPTSGGLHPRGSARG